MDLCKNCLCDICTNQCQNCIECKNAEYNENGFDYEDLKLLECKYYCKDCEDQENFEPPDKVKKYDKEENYGLSDEEIQDEENIKRNDEEMKNFKDDHLSYGLASEDQADNTK
jgi:hypothetical protein